MNANNNNRWPIRRRNCRKRPERWKATSLFFSLPRNRKKGEPKERATSVRSAFWLPRNPNPILRKPQLQKTFFSLPRNLDSLIFPHRTKDEREAAEILENCVTSRYLNRKILPKTFFKVYEGGKVLIGIFFTFREKANDVSRITFMNRKGFETMWGFERPINDPDSANSFRLDEDLLYRLLPTNHAWWTTNERRQRQLVYCRPCVCAYKYFFIFEMSL